jgi:hypothetical protein
MSENQTILLSLAALSLAFGCRPDPGTPDYGGQDQWLSDAGDDDDATDDPDDLDGIVPWEQGDERMGLGALYEGPCLVCVQIDDISNHFYVYSNEFTGRATFQTERSDDRVEGYESEVWQHSGEGWMGGGIHYDEPIFLEDWHVMRVALKSSDPVYDGAQITMTGGGDSAAVGVADYGFVSDGEWHGLEIPLTDFAAGGADLSSAKEVFVLTVAGGEAGNSIAVDDLYLARLDDE